MERKREWKVTTLHLACVPSVVSLWLPNSSGAKFAVGGSHTTVGGVQLDHLAGGE